MAEKKPTNGVRACANAREDRAGQPCHRGALFFIAREAVTNIIKHARTTCIDVILTQEDSALTLRVRDNGQGIDEKEKVNRHGRQYYALSRRAYRLRA